MGAANLKAKYESEGFDEEYNNLIDTLNVNSADLRYKTSLLEKAFDFDYKEAEKADERAYQAQQAEKQFGRQKELAEFQQDLALSGNQAEFEQKIKQQAQLASDPYTAIQTVMDEYAKLGVRGEQGIQKKMEDAKAFIAKGGTLSGYVDQMIKDYQAKPEYKNIIAVQNAKTIKTPDIQIVGQTTDKDGNKINQYAYWDGSKFVKTDVSGIQSASGLTSEP